MDSDLLEDTLVVRFGLDSFRPGQRKVIESILSGRDTLLVAPTGMGKSLTFQLPALLMDGVALVVSPLISLMQDQVSALGGKFIEATFLNSSLSKKEYDHRLRHIREGKYKLAYIAPERFANKSFMEDLKSIKVSMLVVDECHAISTWGHDFRPDYRVLGKVRQYVGNPPVMAVTATATPQVREDVVKQLRMQDPLVHVTGFDRPNLVLDGRKFHSDEAKWDALKRMMLDTVLEEGSIQRFEDVPCVIIYCGTKSLCGSVSHRVNEHATKSLGLERAIAKPYHADLTAEERKKIQSEWSSGEVPWVVATIAFGMGIDKPDVRYVLHYTLPGSVEAYYQEVGRAGRDGRPSRCNLFYSDRDIALREAFIRISHPPRRMFVMTLEVLKQLATPGRSVKLRYDTVADRVVKRTGYNWVSHGQAKTCLTYLKKAGVFIAPGRGQIMLAESIPSLDKLRINHEDIADRQSREFDKLEKMKRLITSPDKRRFILDYFEEGKC